ncbi:MAG TPA: DUF58 domain-containing protein [Thermoleophilia bacterium]|nr:DUF58 domain-containing protein [Thermoleophilia bacterium]
MTRPTARGAALLAAGVATYLAARLVGTWELYLMGFALLAAVLVAWLQVRAVGGRLRVTRSVTPPQPVAGDPLSVSFRVESASRVPGQQVTLLHAGGELGGRDEPIHVESLGSLAERMVTAGPWPARRGIYHLPALLAVAEDPLGLVQAQRRLSTLDVVVVPRLVHLGSCELLVDKGVRGAGSRRVPMLRGSDFRSIRPHEPGEPLNRVDWKATAKTGNLMLRETEDPADSDVTLLLNGAAKHMGGEPPESNFELAVEAAGSLADYALRIGNATTLLLPEHDWRPIHLTPDANGHVRLLQILAGVKPQGLAQLGPSLRGLIAGRRRSERTRTVILVVTAMDDVLVRELVSLGREGLSAAVVHVPADSFTPSAAAESSSLQPALSAAGVRYIRLSRDEDLLAALSLPADDRRARAR